MSTKNQTVSAAAEDPKESSTPVVSAAEPTDTTVDVNEINVEGATIIEPPIEPPVEPETKEEIPQIVLGKVELNLDVFQGDTAEHQRYVTEEVVAQLIREHKIEIVTCKTDTKAITSLVFKL